MRTERNLFKTNNVKESKKKNEAKFDVFSYFIFLDFSENREFMT